MNIAIITGASTGMGRELAIQLCDQLQLDEMWLIARSEELMNGLREEIPVPVRIIAMDLSRPESIERYRDLLEFARPNVVLLANVAGFGRFDNCADIALEESMNMIDLNVKATVAVTESTIPYMGENSAVLEWASLAAFQPTPYMNVYAASKAFVLSYSRALNRELKPRGIRVMAVCPYWTDTRFFARAIRSKDCPVRNIGKLASAEDVVLTALHDLFNTRKDVSVTGFGAKAQRLSVKLLPHNLVMRIWLSKQKKRKLPPALENLPE